MLIPVNGDVSYYPLFTKAAKGRAGLVTLRKSQNSSREGKSVGMSTRGDSFITGSSGWEIYYQILPETRSTAVKKNTRKGKPD